MDHRSAHVGYYGSGTLSVTDGGAVSITPSGTGAFCIGYLDGSTGVVTVAGAGSTLTDNMYAGMFSGLFVGGGPTYPEVGLSSTGKGTLNIINGGAVSTYVGNIGYSSNSTGVVCISGIGSNWTTGYVVVGCQGNGTLKITDGGTLNSTSSSGDTIANYQGVSGMVTVDGTGSEWTSSYIRLGLSGTGTLSVTGGGAVLSTGTVSVGTYSLLAIDVGAAVRSTAAPSPTTARFASSPVPVSRPATPTSPFPPVRGPAAARTNPLGACGMRPTTRSLSRPFRPPRQALPSL